MYKTINKIIGLSILAISAVVLTFALSGCNQAKKVVGNWHIKSLTVNSVTQNSFYGKDMTFFIQKNINDSKADIYTFKDDMTFEESLFGKLISGTYTVDGDKVIVNPTSDNKGQLEERTLKIQGDTLVDDTTIHPAVLEKCDVSASENSKQVRRELGLVVLDLTFYFAGIEGVSAEQVVSKFETLQDALEGLSNTDKNAVLKEVEAQYHDKFVDAFNKLDDKQKERVSKLNNLLKFSVGK